MVPQSAGFARGHISEIEGLRGIALSLVVVFHLFGQGRVSGGVDVFLVVSGFLLTLSLARAAVTGKPIGLARRYSRTLLRLMPLVLLVLSAVAVFTVMVSPQSTWAQTGREIIASALFFENVELINSQLSYDAAGPLTSPLQHFWSLSIQGQFFFIWPALIALVVWLCGRKPQQSLNAIILVTGALTLASFVHATWLNSVDPTVAYFDSGARFWEIGVGSLVALALPSIPALSVTMRTIFGWVGLIVIVACGFVVDGVNEFPGPAALLPVAGAVLIIVSAGSQTRMGADRFLNAPPVKFVAALSYPLYLWHWPVLIAYLTIRQYPAVGVLGGLVVLTVSIVLAWLSNLLVSRPVTKLRDRITVRRGLLLPLAATSVLVVTMGVGVNQFSAANTSAIPESIDVASYPGALALTPGSGVELTTLPVLPPIPNIDVAGRDLSEIRNVGCVQSEQNGTEFDEVLICNPVEIDDTRTRVVLSGGSHVSQWYEPMKLIAEREGWDLITVDKTGCRLQFGDDIIGNASCKEWNKRAVFEIMALQPSAVVTLGTVTTEDGTGERPASEAQLRAWSLLDAAGITTIGIRDNPRLKQDAPRCLEGNPNSADSCGIDRNTIYAPSSPTLDAGGLPESYVELDVTDQFCVDGFCPAVIGNVIVYRDDDHLTATYATTLVQAVDEQLMSIAPDLYDSRRR
ncbi:MAG: acyltransferase family protein [Mycetocola sp.]